MSKTRTLRDGLTGSSITRLMGAHSALSAKLGEEAGFEAIWASGLEISAARALPDANILSMAECLEAAAEIAGAVDIPVLADCDSGFGGVGNVAHMVRSYESRGLAGVCIEDKQFPKLNSFVEGHQDLAPVGDFAAKITAAKEARRDEDFVVVARIEALIAGAGMDEALRRAAVYEAAGADALLIHSKRATPDEVYAFRAAYDGALPVIVVPTTYPQVTAAELAERGFGAVIYANQGLRASITAMRDVLAQIGAAGSTLAVEESIAGLKDVFALQKVDELLARQERHDELTATYSALG
ncbi:isocitrate lyase/phosphoenolpyruvate mutase family protein [Streptomyces sp. MMG1121]|uniref:isocitrate lyase/phosphoenolpyruvate mutase family protein n=1 Tax=Streptomyces sp. MMG1121 TaxID=1415544 RepID=UPI0003C9381E|nr:isocitrate lyase/phosphoenolpyruvate mutase family protein [Streptomyces sp. MMG1121]AGZ94192.1 PEP mutase [Streptomyces sp. MMG1121]KOV63458.1 phosphoenolpyruvate phosphomutase [Streptomyces sp. MMG1121]